MGSCAAADALCSSKRLIGRTYKEAKAIRAARKLFSTSLVALPDGSAGLDYRGRSYSPIDVAAEVLTTLLDQAEAACGVRAARAVVGVPAHFTEAQRAATLAAAERAGLDKVRLLEEPVAAALAYGVGGGGGEELVLVFDLGGGTLDVSLMRVGSGTAEVLSSAGEPWLGGDDVDIAVAAQLGRSESLCFTESGLPADEKSASLRDVARRLKERLTVAKSAEVALPAELQLAQTLSEGGMASRGVGAYASAEALGALGSEVTEQLDVGEGLLSVEAFEAMAATARVAEEEAAGASATRGDDADDEAPSATSSPATGSSADAHADESVTLTRAALESACTDVLQQMREPVLKACAQAQVPLPGAAGGKAARAAAGNSAGKLARPSMKGQRVDCVLRVGAASRMPAVGSTLEALIGVKCPVGTVRPEHAVALGAAVQAGILEGAVEQLDVFSPFEAALIRGIATGSGKLSQRERTGEASGSKRNKGKRRRRA